jgi:gamma-glutamylcyclotransferase (GGCT)/AIG2-like uncharacterized protein YtfP
MPINDSRSLARSTKAAIVHKVIDITPEQPSPAKQELRDKVFAMAEKHRMPLIGGAAVLFALIVGTLAIPHHGHTARTSPGPTVSVPTLAQAAPPAPQKPLILELNLPTAVQQGLIECEWRGNGRDQLFMDARSLGAQPLKLHLAAGQILASTDSTVVVLKSQTLDVAPHGILHEVFPTVATSSANKVIGEEYHLTEGTLPDLDKLFSYVADHPATNAAAIQTATLILTENLPLSAFAKFNELSAGDVTESQNFKADTADILAALMIVKDIGISRPLAVMIDPQLEVEAMIDPAAHGLAIQYYGITDEWTYWKNQLLAGDPSTRHYALYGIARFYPDVALQMLPKWARGETVSPVFRISAVEALAETNRAEAIPILRELEREFGSDTDMGRAAHQGANYLDAQFAHSATTTAATGASVASAGN